VNRTVQATVLALIGGAMLRATFTDLYLRYVKAELRPLLLAAGIVLIVAAGATAWYEWRHSRGNRTAGHGHREPRISWLLLLPLFALVFVTPPALGSYSAMHTGTGLQPPWGLAPLPAGNPVPLGLVDYAGRAAYDNGRSLGDRRVTITGFLAFDENGEPYLTRMILNCCAADAQPVKIGLSGQIPPVLQPDSWLEVTGAYTGKQIADPINGGPIPFIDVSEARPVPAPPDEYESW
jgi:putative membrane protein